MIKVEHTKPYPTAEATIGGVKGWVQVADAELVIIQIGERLVDDPDTPLKAKNNPSCFRILEKGSWIYYSPILISKTEKIKEDDWFYNTRNGIISKAEMFQGAIGYYNNDRTAHLNIQEWHKKILALPEHFPQGTLDVMAEGRLTSGNKCLVECERPDTIDEDERKVVDFKNYQIKLNPHITIYPVEYPVEEKMVPISLLKEAFKAGEICYQCDGNEGTDWDTWFEQNVK